MIILVNKLLIAVSNLGYNIAGYVVVFIQTYKLLIELLYIAI
jgi:hypothetical protein